MNQLKHFIRTSRVLMDRHSKQKKTNDDWMDQYPDLEGYGSPNKIDTMGALNFAKQHDWGEHAEIKGNTIINLGNPRQPGRKATRRATLNDLREYGRY